MVEWMNDQRNTALAIPDMPDLPPRQVNIEAEQQEYMDAIFGRGWEKRLEEKEGENHGSKRTSNTALPRAV